MTDKEGDPIDLSTSGLVTVSARRANDAVNLISGQNCTISAAGSGLVTYTIQSGDFSSRGKYHFQTSYRTSGAEITCWGLTVRVREDFEPRA